MGAGMRKPSLGEGSRARVPSLASVISFIAVAGSALFVLLQLQPGLIVTDTTAAGGDMGAHVWGPAYLRDHVLTKGRVTGWTPDWYAGFPAFHFYFPLPSLLIVALDLVLPYNVAFKLVTVSGLVALPVAAWALGRLTQLPFPIPPLMAVATIPFVFDRFHTIWGGNAAATLAGEFAFSISLSLALVFIGVMYRALETGKGRALGAVLLAATALCHLLPAAFAVLSVGVLLLLRRPDKVRWRLVFTVGLVGLMLASFWFLPFMVRHLQGYSNDMGWERTQEYVKNLLPWLLTEDRAPAASTRHLKLVMPLAVIGVGLGIARRRRATAALGLIAAACGVAFAAIPHGAIWNARFLPFWYLTSYLLAATAVGEGALWAGEGLIGLFRDDPRDVEADGEPVDAPSSLYPPVAQPVPLDAPPTPPNVPALVAPIAVLVAAIAFVGAPLGLFQTGRIEMPGNLSIPFVKRVTTESNFVPAWARWNYSGYEKKPAWPELQEVRQTMARLGRDNGCGRAMWEYEPELNRFGTPMALMLLPHWTDGCIGSMEGLYFESSASVPYHFLNQSELSKTPSRAMRDLPYRNLNISEGVKHLQLMGVRYYMATTPEAQAQAAANPDLELVATTSPRQVDINGTQQTRTWQIYEVADSDVVVPLENRPAVVEEGAKGQDPWLDVAVDWYQDSTRWDVPLADEGPSDWPTVPSAAEALAVAPPRDGVGRARVSDIEVKDDRISFKVDRPGTPVLVRTSYFPNWKVRGADGPWRVTPNFMVVIPTDDEVTLRYGWTLVDVVGWLLTILGAVLTVGLARAGAVHLPGPRRRRRAEEDTPWVDPFAPTPSVFAGTAVDEPASSSESDTNVGARTWGG